MTTRRPYVMIHMMMTVDGRIDCPVVAQVSGQEYYDALDMLGKSSKLSGRVTAALECPAVKAEWTEAAVAQGGQGYHAEAGNVADAHAKLMGEETVNVATKSSEYTIVMDSHGRLQWQDNEADGHPLLCILSEDVPQEHLQQMREMGISWISTGKGHIDLARAMELAHEQFGVERIAVVGGGNICGGFLSAGLVDEVSVMMAPGIDGRKGQTAVFDGIVKDDNKPYRLKLNSVQQWEGTETIWLRYSVKK